MEIRQARMDEWIAALELAFSADPPSLQAARVANCLSLLVEHPAEAEGLWIALRTGDTSPEEGIVGVLSASLIPDRGVIVQAPILTNRPVFNTTPSSVASASSQAAEPPQGMRESQDAIRACTAASLVRHALAWAKERGAVHASAMLAVDASPEGVAALDANGFTRASEMIDLTFDLTDGVLPMLVSLGSSSSECEEFHVVPSSAVSAPFFAGMVERTFAGTLDFPELNDVRTVDDLLNGRRATGVHRPELWQVAFRNGTPAGVVLLIESTDGCSWELSYLGVVPEHRRKGVARLLVEWTLAAARRGGANMVRCSVDVRNLPARRLYDEAGFLEERRLVVYLHALVSPANLGSLGTSGEA